MADYYPLIARAVAALEKNTGEARRALYERARSALVAQLKGSDPPLEEGEITRERLGLEEAIRKVEAEAARRARQEPAAPAPPAAPGQQRPAAPPRPAPPPHRPAAPPQRPGPVAPPPKPPPIPGAPQKPGMAPPAAPGQPSVAPRYEARRPPGAPGQPQRPPAPPPGRPAQPPPPQRPAPPSARPHPSGETIDNLRADLGMAPRAAPTRDDPFADLPPTHDFDRLDTTSDPRIARHALRPQREAPQEFDLGPPEDDADGPPPRRGLGRAVNTEQDLRPRPLYLRLIKPVVGMLLLLALVAFGYWQRDTIAGLYQALVGPPPPVAEQTSPPAQPGAQPKISDRLGQPGQTAGPSVAQRVVLYEEEPADPQGKRFVGSAIWRTETVSAGPGQPPELAVRADVEIPERRMTMKFSIRRNTDPALPASHTIEIMFDLPPDFPGGGISNVPGILMKQSEQTRGVPLSGLAVKVMPGFFLIGLSAVEADVQRNIQLLKERGWFDIPVVYNNNRRAILALEKGTPGERAFAEAFAAWKQ